MRPPPGGMPAQTLRTSPAQVRRIGNSCRDRKRRSVNNSGGGDAGASAADGAPGAASVPVARPPRLASAPWHALDTSALLRSRHSSAARPPGCTPEQREIKSDLQAARMALICFALGCRAVARGAAAATGGTSAAGGGVAAAAGTAGLVSVGAAGAATDGAALGAGGAAAALVARTLWQDAESCDALARRQSRSSGLFGAIHEQCDTKSSSVQARRTAASWSCSGPCACCGWGAAVTGCGGWRFGTAALIALLQVADNCAALFCRHASASRPPG